MDNEELKRIISEEMKKNVEFVIDEAPEDTQPGRRINKKPIWSLLKKKNQKAKDISTDDTQIKSIVPPIIPGDYVVPPDAPKPDNSPEPSPDDQARIGSYQEFIDEFDEWKGKSERSKVIQDGISSYLSSLTDPEKFRKELGEKLFRQVVAKTMSSYITKVRSGFIKKPKTGQQDPWKMDFKWLQRTNGGLKHTGEEKTSPEEKKAEEIWDLFKNSEFALDHVQNVVAEEKENDE